jgi:hypothetical protein
MVTSIIERSTLALGALLLSSSAVWAVAGDVAVSKVLNTSSLYAGSGKTYHACNATNVTTSNVLLKIDLIDQFGDNLATTGTSALTLDAGLNFELVVTPNETFTGFARCRFLVYSGNADEIRANETVFYFNGTYYETVAFSEAR